MVYMSLIQTQLSCSIPLARYGWNSPILQVHCRFLKRLGKSAHKPKQTRRRLRAFSSEIWKKRGKKELSLDVVLRRHVAVCRCMQRVEMKSWQEVHGPESSGYTCNRL